MMDTPRHSAITHATPAAAEEIDGYHAHLGKAHGILGRCHATASRLFLQKNQLAIQDVLQQQGISFEGKRLPVSLTPTILADAELQGIARKGAHIRAALQEIIARFIEEHQASRLDGPMHGFFQPYRKWWDLIAAERRTSEPIQLMRYDAIREDRGAWRIIETNTCCPGGTIHCARVRNAWLASPLGQEATRGVRLVELPIDRPDAFLRHMVELARVVSGQDAPSIAICSYLGFYQNELASLVAEHRRLIERHELPAGELLLCDAREVECNGGVAQVRGKQVAVIYNKLDPLMIDPTSPELAGWVQAAMSPRVDFLNSLAAMYLTEAKRVLALLRDERRRGSLDLDAQTIAAIEELIPPSHVLPALPELPALPPPDALALGADDALLLAELHGNRHHYVLKPDALTRGAGVHLGKQLAPEDWTRALRQAAADHGIAQECADTPRRIALDPDGGGEPIQEYWGVDLFYFGAQFAGAVSRSHTNMVFNIGNGGRESPTLIVA